MFKIIRNIINLALLVVLALSLYFLIIQPSYVVYILDEVSLEISNNGFVRFLVEIVIVIYFVIFLLSLIERFFRKPKNIHIKGSNGNIVVNLKTIEEVSKNFLEEQSIIKKAQANVRQGYKGFVINASIENYNTNQLNNKLGVISSQLSEHIEQMIGVRPKDVNINVNKINNEHITEETIDNENYFEKVVNSENEDMVSLD